MYRYRSLLALVLLAVTITACGGTAVSSRPAAKPMPSTSPASVSPVARIEMETLTNQALPTPVSVINEPQFIARPTAPPATTPAAVAPATIPTTTGPVGASATDCGYGEVLSPYRGYGDWYRTLLDLRYMIPADYRPNDLTPITDSGAKTGTYGLSYARSIVMPDLTALVDAVRAAGLGQLQINTAFRDYNMQLAFWNSYRNGGGGLTYPTTLPPGHSEHQLGTTFDFNVYAAAGLNTWMSNNAYKYGFIKSFPGGRNAEHCIGTEDWHYRYVGRDMAAQVANSGLTLRGYLLHLLP